MKLDPVIKYQLYEYAVQSPEVHAKLFDELYDAFGKRSAKSKSLTLCEDFCGTGQIMVEWVKRAAPGIARKAIGLDLDPEPIRLGRERLVGTNQVRQVQFLRKNVLSRTRPAADLVVACNFSFYIFQKRRELVSYFQTVRSSLKPGGVFVLEMVGGSYFVSKGTERRTLNHPEFGKYRYYWEKIRFDPVLNHGLFSIHFEAFGKKLKHVFTYDWRLWSIPEVVECLEEAGFPKVQVLWEMDKKKTEFEGGYDRVKVGTNDLTWGALVVGSGIE